MRKPHPLVLELEKAREAAGLSLAEASRLAGMSRGVVARWVSGESEPTVYCLEKYLKVLGRHLQAVSDHDRAALLNRLELERTAEPVIPRHLLPITPEIADDNRKLLAAAIGTVDDYAPGGAR